MAGEATIGALRVILGADTAKFEDNLKSALSSLESFGKKALTIATGIQLSNIFQQAFQGVVESITGAIDAADKLAKTSAKFGVPTDTLAALSSAAALSDVSIEELGASIGKLSKSMISASGPTSDQAVAFKALGISVKDSSGQLKGVDDILGAVADSFSGFKDGATKTAIAIALFGRAGADMIPVLDKGSAGIKEMHDRFIELNPNVDANAKAANAYKDNLKELAIAKDAIIIRILGSSGMLAAMQELTKTFVGAAGASSSLADELGNNLGAILQTTIGTFNVLKFAGDALAQDLNGLNAALAQIAKGQFSAAWDTMSAAMERSDEAAAQAKAAFDALGKSGDQFAPLAASLEKLATAQTQLKDLKFDPNFEKNLTKFNEELAKMHDRALDISGAFAGQLAPGFLAATANMEALKGQITVVGDQFVRLGPLAEKFNQAMLQVAGQQLIQSTLPAWQQFEQQIIKNTTALTAMGMTAQQIATINQQAALNAGVAWQNAAQSITASLAAGFAGFAAKNKEFAGIAKAAAIAEAVANTYLAATKALAAYPPPFGEIAAAASVVAGLGMVAKIQAQQFAKGGSFMVPGGMNSRDNMMVPLALSGGERVDITPSGQAHGGGGGRIPTINLGVGMSDFITGSNLRDLVDALNQGARDGYRLKVVS